MSEIEISDISKTYNPGLFKRKVRAVTALTLEVRKGEVFGLVGPNGAGKSSTIRMILGMSRPDKGAIRIRGETLTSAMFRKDIGYLPENPYLYDHLSLEELLTFCGHVSGLSASTVQARSREIMEKLSLHEVRKRPLRTFSKGMLQRAGICFALLHDPSIVILDEPMSGLDPIGRRMVFDLVTELKDQGKTIFFCSHILSDVERLCDRIGVMVAGRLVRILAAEEFSADPQRSIHLLLPPLDAEQANRLASLPCSLTRTEGGTILSLMPEDLVGISETLQQCRIDIRASQSERVSLEDIFLTLVKEHQA